MKNENEDSPRKEINTTKHFWLIFFFNLEKHYTIMLCHAKSLQSAHQAPLSRTFSRQEYWSGLPFPSARNLSDPGIKPPSLKSPALAGEFLTTQRHLGSPQSGRTKKRLNYQSELLFCFRVMTGYNRWPQGPCQGLGISKAQSFWESTSQPPSIMLTAPA